MPIKFHETSKEFHLYNEQISYIIEILENSQLGNLYYGKRIKDRESFAHLHEETWRSLAAYACPEPSVLSLQHTKQEYPSYGTTDFRYPAFEIEQLNGSKISDFKFVDYCIHKGKIKLEGLPATYVENDEEADTLELTLYDALTETKLVLSYTIYKDYPVIVRNAKFIQVGNQVIKLTNTMSAAVDLPDYDFEMLHLAGAWTRERHVKVRPLEQGVQSIHSMRGASSAEHNPFIALKRPEADEHNGEVYGFSLVYSGNFLGQVEVDSHGMTRIVMGIHPNMFCWRLEQGEHFQTPEIVMVYSNQGLNYMSQTYHKLYRKRLVRGYWRDRERPILINNWEATGAEFTEDLILDIAKTSKDVGIELFVLDDGWFGKRNNDRAGLGDWFVNKKKIPSGIDGLSEKIEAIGLKFGLWFEPEMVNKDSDLYRNHPDWILETPNRHSSPCRYQYVLDFSRQEVVDYIYQMMSEIFRESKISYVKWDMNRYITECYSTAAIAENQGKIMHQYILGVYSLYERLTSEFPYILFESCASGGARFDPGMLYYASQVWTSDDTDAYERQKIQYGTSYVYPTITMGAHVSVVPNQQVNRITPIETRANVAYFGAFGYELDFNELSKDELEKVKQQVKYMKQHRSLIQNGNFYRIKSPFKGNSTAWIVVSENKEEALLGYYQILNESNTSWLRLRLVGLDNNIPYEVISNKIIGGKSVRYYYGDELMNAGLVINREELCRNSGDFASEVFYIKRVNK